MPRTDFQLLFDSFYWRNAYFSELRRMSVKANIPSSIKFRIKGFFLNLNNHKMLYDNINKTKNIYNDKYKGLKIGLLDNRAIGPLGMLTDYYLKMGKIYNYNLINDIVLITTSKTCNFQLQKMIERVANVIEDDELFSYINNGGHLYLRKYRKYIDWEHGEWATIYKNFYTDCPRLIDFNEKEIVYGNKLLKKLGVYKNDKFVIVHSRDNNYWQNKRGISKPFFEIRNSDFNALIRSIEYLKKQGVKIIRVGYYSDLIEPPYISLNVLTEKERDFMDIFVQRFSSFSILGDSGITDVSYLFRTPILTHNCIALAKIPIIGKKSIFIPKKFREKTNKKRLTIKKLRGMNQNHYSLERGLFLGLSISGDEYDLDSHFIKSDIELIENSEDEILDAVKEMLKMHNGKLNLTEQEKALQLKFKMLFPVGHPRRHSAGIISPSFLAKHEEILN